MKGTWTGGLALGVACWAATAAGQEIQWRSASPQPSAPVSVSAAPVTLGRPVAADLGAPIPLDQPATIFDPNLTRTSYLPAPQPIIRGQSPDVPRPMPPGPVNPPPGTPLVIASSSPAGQLTSMSNAAPAPPAVGGAPAAPAPTVSGASPVPVVPPTPEEQYNAGVVTSTVPPDAMCEEPCWWDECCCFCKGFSFQSDHCFDGLISPITNPYFFIDPRSSTELRPIYMFQKIPANNPAFGSGEINTFALQTRIHFFDWLSLEISRLGWLALSPDPTSAFPYGSGFSELNIGPKWTFLRLPNTGTIAAAGLNFQIPSGPIDTFQNTGQLSLNPYLSVAQTFWRTSYGSVNFMGTTGASVGVDNVRTDWYFLSLHLDYNIANANKLYPLIELHWFNYTGNGKNPATAGFDFEGRDLINFGAGSVVGHNTLSMATGFRYKFAEWAQAGIAAEWPISGHKDLEDFRLTVDFILRY